MSLFPTVNLPAIYTKGGGAVRPLDLDFIKTLQSVVLACRALLNRGLKFSDNFDASLVSVTSHATPGVEFSVTHTLGRVPVGYIVYGQTAAGSVYDGATSWDETTLYLKSDASSKTFKLIVI